MAHEMIIDHMACNIESRVPKKYPMLKTSGITLVLAIDADRPMVIARFLDRNFSSYTVHA